MSTAPAVASDVTARDIASLLFKAAPGTRPALSGKDLTRLDLANLDFKKANLSGSNLFGADLSGADLSGADLSGAMLDRVTLVGARLDGAQPRQCQHDAAFDIHRRCRRTPARHRASRRRRSGVRSFSEALPAPISPEPI